MLKALMKMKKTMFSRWDFDIYSAVYIHGTQLDREDVQLSLSAPWCNMPAPWHWLISQYAPCKSRQAPGLLISHLSRVHCSRGRLGPIKTRVLTRISRTLIVQTAASFITQGRENGSMDCNGHNQAEHNQSHTRLFSYLYCPSRAQDFFSCSKCQPWTMGIFYEFHPKSCLISWMLLVHDSAIFAQKPIWKVFYQSLIST